MKIIEFKCPHCGADLTVEEGRSTLFCQYCGSKIGVDSESETVIRFIDEAEIKRVSAEREVKIARIMAEKRRYKIPLLISFCFFGISAAMCLIDRLQGKQFGEGILSGIGIFMFLFGIAMLFDAIDKIK